MTQNIQALLRFRGLQSRHILSLALGLLPGACLIDADNPCRDNESFDETTYICSCLEGYGLSDDGCVKCGKNEVGMGNACTCKTGYARTGDGPCKEIETPPASSSSGGSSESGAGSSEAPPTKLSAEGEGTACTEDSTCSGFPDANVCDTFVGACSIKNCTLEPNNCPDTYLCCDVSAFAPGAPPVCIKDACPGL